MIATQAVLIRPTISQALRALAALDADRAREVNAAGFNKIDGDLGHKLAAMPEQWMSPKQRYYAYKMLAKYRRQLSGLGIDYRAIVAPPVPTDELQARHEADKAARLEARRQGRRIGLIGTSTLAFLFEYDEPLIAELKTTLPVRWHKDAHQWRMRIELDTIPAVRDFARRRGFFFSDNAEEEIARIEGEQTRRIEHSRAASAEFHVEGLLRTLYPFQAAGVRYAVEAERCVIADEMGLGKTIQAIATTHYLDGYPALTQCPASVKINWRREWEATIPGVRVAVLQGKPRPDVVDRLKGFLALYDHVRRNGLEELGNCGGVAEIPTVDNPLSAPLCIHTTTEARHEVHQLGGNVRNVNSPHSSLPTNAAFSVDDGGKVRAFGDGRGDYDRPGAVPSRDVISSLAKFKNSGAVDAELSGNRVKLHALREQGDSLLCNGLTYWGFAHAHVLLCNYDILHAWADVLSLVSLRTSIADEAHALKSPKAQRTVAATQIVTGLKQKRNTDGKPIRGKYESTGEPITIRLALTGTPVLSRPAELVAILKWLDRLEEVGGYWSVVNCKDEIALNQKLRARCYVRREKRAVLPELPAIQRTRVTFPIDNRAEYKRVEHDVIAYVYEQAAKDEEFLASVAHLGEEAQKKAIRDHQWSRAATAARAKELVAINALKTVAAQGKLAAVKQWVAGFAETGEALILFADHIEVQKALVATFPGCAAVLGEMGGEERQANVDRFQTDPDCRLIVCSLGAAREGITLTRASNVAFVELGWVPGAMDQAEARCYGRMSDLHGANAWYLIAEDTIDEWIEELIAEKRAIVDALTIGAEKVEAAETSVAADVLARLKAKGGH